LIVSEAPLRRSIANRKATGLFRSIQEVEQPAMEATFGAKGEPDAGRNVAAQPTKKLGRIEVRPKFREEKPEGLAGRCRRVSGPGPHDLYKGVIINKWLMATYFLALCK
jgi:hypothetical protein